jgi:hypothetical protein
LRQKGGLGNYGTLALGDQVDLLASFLVKGLELGEQHLVKLGDGLDRVCPAVGEGLARRAEASVRELLFGEVPGQPVLDLAVPARAVPGDKKHRLASGVRGGGSGGLVLRSCPPGIVEPGQCPAYDSSDERQHC